MTSRPRRALRVLACAAACGWVVLLLAAPWLAAAGDAGAGLSAASYLVGSLVCHQHGERSFHLGGAQLPVCARCTGLYLAGAWGLVLGLVLGAWEADPLAALARRWGWRRLLTLAALPMAATVGLEWAGAWAVSNAWRAATSVPAGWAVGALIAESLSFRVTLSRCVRTR